jgi:dissimilatory sulfite reductase (desulfoviridin) alpha/beta subunit
MNWTQEAEKSISRVPFFVRKRVRKRVEEEAQRVGAEEVRLEHVFAAQNKFVNQMEKEVRGYQIESCFGASGCPNRAAESEELLADLEKLVASKNLKAFQKERVQGSLKLHHEFRISLSECPNACSRPQIVDVGIIGAMKPGITEAPCSRCDACVETCREEAITSGDQADVPSIDLNRCLSCGQCIKACPTGTLEEGERGYRILVGGKLGRHPQLGQELPGIYSRSQVMEIVDRCLSHFMAHYRPGERFGEILNRTGVHDLLH